MFILDIYWNIGNIACLYRRSTRFNVRLLPVSTFGTLILFTIVFVVEANTTLRNRTQNAIDAIDSKL